MWGTAVFRLLEFYLDRWFGEAASFLLGAIYVGIVLFIPFGLVGTRRLKAFERERGWRWLRKLLGRDEG